MSASRCCLWCRAPLVQRPGELDMHWEKRRHCGHRCAAQRRARAMEHATDEVLVAVWREVGTLQATGEVVGLSRERVRQRLKRLGLVSDGTRGKKPGRKSGPITTMRRQR